MHLLNNYQSVYNEPTLFAVIEVGYSPKGTNWKSLYIGYTSKNELILYS